MNNIHSNLLDHNPYQENTPLISDQMDPVVITNSTIQKTSNAVKRRMIMIATGSCIGASVAIGGIFDFFCFTSDDYTYTTAPCIIGGIAGIVSGIIICGCGCLLLCLQNERNN